MIQEKFFKVELEDDKSRLTLLYDGEVFVSGIQTERKQLECGKSTTYITCADSTGYRRGKSSLFFTDVLRGESGLVVCFSNPRKELIFGKSSENPYKKILSSIQLFNFWKNVLKNRSIRGEKNNSEKTDNYCCKLYTWSNFDNNNSHPFSHLNEIVKFRDDPKSKMLKYFTSTKELFASLLVRSDFVNGGLLFSVCRMSHQTTEYRERISDTDDAIALLRSLDFSSLAEAKKSTSLFLETYNCRILPWLEPSVVVEEKEEKPKQPMSEYQEETAIKTIKGMASEIIETLAARTTELKQTIAKNKQKAAKEARKGAEENARLLHRLESLKKGCDTLISQRENLQQTLERETKELNKLGDENQNLERQYRELQEAGTSLIEKKNELQNKLKHQDAQYKVLSTKHKQLEEEVAEENRNYRTYLGIDIQKFKENVLKVSFSSLGVECYLILDFKNDPSVVECVPDLGVEKLDYIFKEECDFYGFIKRVRSEFLTYLGTR